MSPDTEMIPVIFITAHVSEEIRQKVLETGAKDFIAKPFTADDLLSKVKKALDEVDGNEVEGQTHSQDIGS